MVSVPYRKQHATAGRAPDARAPHEMQLVSRRGMLYTVAAIYSQFRPKWQPHTTTFVRPVLEVAMAHVRPGTPPDPLDRLVGQSPAIQALRTQIRHLAAFDTIGN